MDPKPLNGGPLGQGPKKKKKKKKRHAMHGSASCIPQQCESFKTPDVGRYQSTGGTEVHDGIGEHSWQAGIQIRSLGWAVSPANHSTSNPGVCIEYIAVHGSKGDDRSV
ncbi:Uncharacterized protein HZ326_15071 [Fusarium oxysporum f. sp. albedinis]|nr:Uncharacterized protein HZ326_15071 [Fusarium oxysporum f. sp. albedinis]